MGTQQRSSPYTSGVLTITHPGILVLRNATNGIIWSSNTTRTLESPVGQLLDSGNLVVKDGNNQILLECLFFSIVSENEK